MGIGTGNPTNKLTISNNGDAVVAFKINDTNANGTSLSLNASNTDTGIIAGGTSAVPIDLYTGNCVRMRISSTGNIGINNTYPVNKLQICTTSTAENVVSITNGTQNLQLGVNTTDGGSYVFEKVCGLRLGTADTERMRITSTGNFGFNITTPNAISGYTRYTFNTEATQTNGSIIDLNVTGTRKGTFYATPNEIYIGSDASIPFIFLTSGGERARISSTGVACFTCQVCAPTGVKFGSGASTLNYYETGTWTPDVIRSTSNPTVSYSSREGTYTRVGNTVNLWFDVTMASISGGSGTYLIAGLPFTVSNSQAGYSRVVWRDFSAAIPDANTVVSGFVQKGDTYIYPQNDFTGVCFQTKGATNLQAGRFTGFVSYQA